MSHASLQSCAAVKALLDQWVGTGWLRPLDRAFAVFLSKEMEVVAPLNPLLMLSAALVSHQAGRGHVCIDMGITLENPDIVLAMPPENREGDALPPLPSVVLANTACAAWLEALVHVAVTGIGVGNSPLVLDGQRLYLRRYWQYEQQIAASLHTRLGNVINVNDQQLATVLDQLFVRDTKTVATDWQKIACALAARSGFAVITGGPGTGKTTTVVKLLAVLQSLALQDSGKNLTIRMAAPTGKAAARLKESISLQVDKLRELLGEQGENVCSAIKTDVCTLHKLLGTKSGSRHFVHHAGNPLLADIVVVDEASMVDVEMMSRLLDALPASTHLILLGDKDQLASVEAGAVLGQLCEHANSGRYSQATARWVKEVTGETLPTAFISKNGSPLDQSITMLRHSHRFGEHSGIGQLSRAVNAGDCDAAAQWLSMEKWSVEKSSANKPDIQHWRLSGVDDTRFDKLIVDGYGACMKLVQDGPQDKPGEAGCDEYDRWASAVLQQQGKFQLLCAVRRGDWGVEGINHRVEKNLGSKGLLHADGEWYAGRPVIVTRNDYSLQLMNGDIGITLPDSQGKLRVVFADSEKPGAVRWVLPARLSAVETVFAMTVHKSQGSEFRHVVLVLPDTVNPVLTRELLYTGITRAAVQFTLVDTVDTVLDSCIQRRVQRVSGSLVPESPTVA
ncbi:MAG TPA: exodeoxyribonuclease V subunit alpha [Pseudomonadales bacterium]|nr:exodeoxyribonuclease V subunit alpha [Pseudomonadales bacterium]